MARPRQTQDRLAEKALLAGRLRQIRIELFGEDGVPDLALRLGIPRRSWYNYEIGVTVPAEVLLRLLDATGAEPHWLLTGEGPRYRDSPGEDSAPGAGMAHDAEVRLGYLLLRAARLLEGGELRISWKPQA